MVRPSTIPHRGPIELHANSAQGLTTRRRQRCDHRLITGYLADNDDSGCGHTHTHESTHIHMMTHTSIHIHMRSTRKAPCLPIMSNRNLGMLGLSQLYFAKLWLSQLDFAKLWLSQLDFAKLCGHYPVMKISVVSHNPCCTASVIFAHSSARHSNIVPARVSTNLAASAQQCSPIIT